MKLFDTRLTKLIILKDDKEEAMRTLDREDINVFERGKFLFDVNTAIVTVIGCIMLFGILSALA